MRGAGHTYQALKMERTNNEIARTRCKRAHSLMHARVQSMRACIRLVDSFIVLHDGIY